MRIVEVVDLGYVAGGAEKSVKLIRDELIKRGHEVLVLSTDKNIAGKQAFADKLIPAISGSAPERLCRFFWNRASYRTMRGIIREFKPDIVHLHTISEFSPALVWGIGRTPALLTVHGPEEFTVRLLPWLLPASDYAGGSYDPALIRVSGRLRYLYYRLLQRPAWLLALRRVRLVIAPSEYMVQAIKPDFPRLPVQQLYNGITLPRSRALPNSRTLTILYVGRLEAVKGVDHLIRAFAAVHDKHKHCTLRIVGEGSQKSELQQLAKLLGVDQSVEFAGWVKPQHIADEFGAASIVAIPSVWPENLPTVAVEALAVGRPIVGSDTGGISELVNDGVNGLLVTPGDETALAAVITELLDDPAKLASAAKASAAMANTFSESQFVATLLDTYKKVAE